MDPISIVKGKFLSQFGSQPELLIKAPGRINLIGEHTDYNQGLVLPAAIDKAFFYAFKKNDSNTVRALAIDVDQYFEIDLLQLNKVDKAWANFFIGLLIQLKLKDLKISGFDCAFHSTIPIGGGMSSSSALECGFLSGVNTLFDLDLESWKMILMSQKSNHEFLGIKGGILDQFSSMMGKKDHCMLLDCASQEFQYYELTTPNHSWVLFNTMVQHDHLTGDYNNGPEECEMARQQISASYRSIQHLSELNSKDLPFISLPSHLMDRVQFIVNENTRVKKFVTALQQNNIHELGLLLYQSHEGLKNKYRVSCKELDLLIELSRNDDHILGARMMGGGFGGCTINLINSDNLNQSIQKITLDYQARIGIKPEAYIVRPEDGVKRISTDS